MMMVVTAIISIFQVYKSLICSQAGESLMSFSEKGERQRDLDSRQRSQTRSPNSETTRGL